MGVVYNYGLADFQSIAAGAAVLASGGGGSYHDACSILQELAGQGWSGTVTVQDYDGATNACVLAIMGSPDAADSLTLSAVQNSVSNTVAVMEASTGALLGALIPVEIGPINSLVPLIGAAMSQGAVWVVNGDGAGRAVPELPQTTFTGGAQLAPCPAVLASDASTLVDLESAVLGASTAARVETLAGGVVAGFGGYSGIAMWPSNAGNGFALSGSYIPGTLEQARGLGQFLLQAATPPATAAVADVITMITGRPASAVVTNGMMVDLTGDAPAVVDYIETGRVYLDGTALVGALEPGLAGEALAAAGDDRPVAAVSHGECKRRAAGPGYRPAGGAVAPHRAASGRRVQLASRGTECQRSADSTHH